MSLDQLARSATQAFSEIVRAETGLEKMQHGDVARAALVECYKFGKQAKSVSADFKTVCTGRDLSTEDFSWTLAVRCVYGAFVSKEKGSNDTVWEVSKSKQVISKYGNILAYAEKKGWDDGELKAELDSLGIEKLVLLARSEIGNDVSGSKTPVLPLFSKSDLTRINARHFVNVDEFDLPEEAFKEGFASILLRKEDDGYSVWAGNADEGIIKKVASPFTKKESVRDHLISIMDLTKFSTDDTVYVHNTTDGVQINGFGGLSFVATGKHVDEFDTGWFSFDKDDRLNIKKLIKHFGDAVFDWSPKQYKGKPVVSVSGPSNISSLVTEINDKTWKPNTTAKFVYQDMTEGRPEYADGTERKIVLLGGNPLLLNEACITKMKGMNKKDEITIKVSNGRISLTQKKGKPPSVKHDGKPVEMEATILKGMLNKAASVLPTNDVRMYLKDDTAQFEFEHEGFVVRIEV